MPYSQKNNNLGFSELYVGRAEIMTRQITVALIRDFSEISGDNSSIHVDQDAARAAGHANQVAHGVISQCYFSALIGTRLPGDSALLIELSSSFRSPILVGDTVTYEAVVAERHEAIQCITLKLKGTNQRGQRTVTGKALVKVCP